MVCFEKKIDTFSEATPTRCDSVVQPRYVRKHHNHERGGHVNVQQKNGQLRMPFCEASSLRGSSLQVREKKEAFNNMSVTFSCMRYEGQQKRALCLAFITSRSISTTKYIKKMQMLRDGDCRRHFTACGVAVQGEMNAIVWRVVDGLLRLHGR